LYCVVRGQLTVVYCLDEGGNASGTYV